MLKIAMATLFFLSAAFLPTAVAQGSPTNMVDAVNVAYQDYAERIKRQYDVEWEHADYLANIRNYDIGVSQTSSIYVVVFLPTDKDFVGGGGEYLIERKSLKIIRFSGYE